jgi:uncharacterized protein YgiM (DUF1202 family)
VKKNKQAVTLITIAMVALSVMAAETVSVVVKKTSVRESAQFFAATVTTVEYNDQLTVLATEDDWLKVDNNGKEGWVHLSAVSEATAAAPSTEGSVNEDYSADEIALAGKGFSGQVEEQYRKDNPDLKFTEVDEIEKSQVSLSAVIEFQEAGKLSVMEITP